MEITHEKFCMEPVLVNMKYFEELKKLNTNIGSKIFKMAKIKAACNNKIISNEWGETYADDNGYDRDWERSI